MSESRSLQDEIARIVREELEHQPLGEIRVADVCRKAGCSRQSFYYYFTSIDDCLLYYLLQEGIAGEREFTSYEEVSLFFFRYVRDNKNFIRNIFTDNYGAHLMEFFFDTVKKKMIKLMIKNNPDAAGLDSEDQDYIASYFTSAWVFSFFSWIRDGFKTTPEQEVERMFVIARGTMIDASNRMIAYRRQEGGRKNG